MCTPVIDPDCSIADSVIGNAAAGALEAWAKASSEAAASVMKMVVSGWVYVPSGKVTDPAGDKTGAVAHLHGHTHWILVALTVAAMLFAGIRMATQPEGREAGQLARNIAMMVLLVGAGVPGIIALIEIGDAYSTWIIDKSADGDFGGRMALVATAAVKGFPGVYFMILILGGVVALSGIIQLLMLLGRSAALILMAGTLPVVAAGALTGRSGMEARNRYLSWLLALILYKPAAATVYAGSFWATGKGDNPMDLFVALALFIMAGFALPALMRLIVPAVSALSSSQSHGTGMALAGGVSTLATGAVQMGSGSAGTSGGGSKGPTGAGMTSNGPIQTQSGGAPTGSATGGAGAATGSGTAGGAAGAGSGTGSALSAGAATSGGGAAAGAAGGPVGVGVMAAAGVAKAGVGVVTQATSSVADGATGASEQGTRR